MNKIILGLLAAALVLGMSSCSVFRRGTNRKTAVAVNDSLKAIMTNPALNDSAKVALANNLLRGAQTPVTVDSAVAPNAGITPIPVTDNDAALLGVLTPVFERQMAYNTFSGKAKVHYEGKDDKQDFTATIRMEKDKKIWVSIVALGLFEAARALITPDSIIVVDRLHKEVKMLAAADAGKLLPVNVDFTTLQSLLVGDALHVDKDRPTGAAMGADGLALTITGDKYDQQIVYGAADTAIAQQALHVKGEKAAAISMRYSNYSRSGKLAFAQNRIIDIQDATGTYHVEMDFSKADFDEQVDFPFSVPAKYTRK